MAILNRDCDVSQQQENIDIQVGAVATGETHNAFVVPYPMTIQKVSGAALGVSNAMQVAFNKLRLISGSGSTAIPIGISNLVLVNFTSIGVQNFSGLAAIGSTLLDFAVGEVVQIVTSVSNGNATDLTLSLVVKKTQDIVTFF